MPGDDLHEQLTAPEPIRPASGEPETTADGRHSGTPADQNRTAPHQPGDQPHTGTHVGRSSDAVREWPEVAGYDVVGELARGGMGVVYSARDLSLDREIAIKTILPHLASDAQFATLFDREARLTALLSHPGVPPIHALGTLADNRPFLAMKLIRGRTFTEVLASQERERPELLRVFEAICQTVGYAHSQGVIHRDLKPGNVMVGAFGEVQVMDWGLAKRVGSEKWAAHREDTAGGDADATQMGQAKGTPAYMSPEQARGEWDQVDARADVFALGGILCVILTGKPPFTGKTGLEVLRRAEAGDLTDAFARLGGCGADAELIALCQRCLAADAADRPADGKAVAEAVAAYRAGVEERARKAEAERAAAEAEAREQRKRRKVQLALVVALGLMLLGGGAFAWWDQKRDAEAREKQQKVELRITAGHSASTALLEQTEKALVESDAERAEAALTEAERRIAEGGIDDLNDRSLRCRSELDMLKTLDGIDNFSWTLRDGKQIPFEESYPRWAKAFADYGITPGVTPIAEAAQRINTSLIRDRLLTSLEVWFVRDGRKPALLAILSTADPDEFRDEARRTNYLRVLLSWAFRWKTLPPGQPIWFAAAHGQDELLEDNVRRQLLVSAYQLRPNNFVLLMTLGAVDNGESRESALARAAWGRAAVAIQPRNVTAWNNLGAFLRGAHDLPAAIAASEQAIKLDSKMALAHYNLAASLSMFGNRPRAIAECREAIRLNPQDMIAHNTLGSALKDSGDLPGAIAAYKEAIRLSHEYAQAYEEASRREHEYAPAYNNLGIALAASGDLAGAISEFKNAIEIDPKRVSAYSDLGNALRIAGDVRGAIEACKKGIEIDPKHVASHYNLGVALQTFGDVPGALATLKEAIRLDPKNAPAHSDLGIALAASNDLPGAIAAYKEAIRLDPHYAPPHNNLAVALTASGDLPGAIAASKEAIRLDPKLGQAYTTLGAALAAAHDLPGAIAEYKAAIKLDSKCVPAHFNLAIALQTSHNLPGAIAEYKEVIALDPKIAQAHSNLGSALNDSGDLPGAIAAYKEAIKADPKYALAYSNLGNLYLRQKMFPEAIACARDAIKVDPKNPANMAMLGVALQETGEFFEAREAFTEAARLDPKRWGPFLKQLPPIPVAPPPREVNSPRP